MDSLGKLTKDHGEIFEQLTVFNNAMSSGVLDANKTPESYIEDISGFFTQNVVKHFEFEEGQIFPPVLSMGSAQDIKLIRELQHEHIDILSKLDEIKDAVGRSGFPLKADKAQIGQIADLGKQALALLMKHARKEDEKLYPILKNKGLLG